jgi:SAM-dependent methyltransferase
VKPGRRLAGGAPSGSSGAASRSSSPGATRDGGTDPTVARALARFYDEDLAEDPGDLDLYLASARRTGGPILELAVGTGRLAVPLARAGFAVTGVDRDPAMLERARERATLASLPPRSGTGSRGAQDRASLELVEGDIVGLDLRAAGSFRLAYLALGSLLLLPSRAAQRAAFEAMFHHLGPGGLAVVDVWLPDADDLARYDGRLGLEATRVDPQTGRVVTKLSSAQHDPASQVVTLTTIYEEGRQGDPVVRWLRTDRLRLVSADEVVGLAEGAGLDVEQVAGGYDLQPIGPGSDRVVLVAVRP